MISSIAANRALCPGQKTFFSFSSYPTAVSDFINVGKKLLYSDNIRFYIKYVFFEVLGQVDIIDVEIEQQIYTIVEQALLSLIRYTYFLYGKLTNERNIIFVLWWI